MLDLVAGVTFYEDTEPPILAALEELGLAVFRRGLWNVNLLGIRSRAREAGVFDDLVGVVYRDHRGSWVEAFYAATTDPGLYWLQNPTRIAGTAILAPGQYRGAYELGLHRGRYQALVQRGPVDVFRDGNRDATLDAVGELHRGYFGINIHRASSSRASTRVGRWSAGCQVVADPDDFDDLIEVCRKSAQLYGPRLTYTLIAEELLP